MAVFELQGPDGKLFEVEAPDAQSAVAAFQKMPQTTQKPVDPMKQRALDQVSAERKASPMMTAVDDTVRNLARGTGIGSFLDEANAATASILPEMLGGRPYDEALAYQRAKNELADKESTVVGKLPVIGDVTVGGLTKLAGGIASAPVTPMARVFQGATLAPRVGNAALTGAGYGALYGAGEGEGMADRATDAAMGAAIGRNKPKAISAAALPTSRVKGVLPFFRASSILRGVASSVLDSRSSGPAMPPP